ncbi:hypothetical protein [Kribbella sp. NPDC006257]|uniref:hypothetical protein n=1 Tax=Kribbella sp. NPDC006257 TaxID=3156738 RepID=UPI0033A3E234
MRKSVVKLSQPPGRVRRTFAAVAAVLFAVRLIVEPSVRNALWALILCPILVAIAVQPKGLHDGRSWAWQQRHPVLLGLAAASFAGIFAYLLLPMSLDAWLSVAISAALGVAYGLLVVVLGRRRYRAG